MRSSIAEKLRVALSRRRSREMLALLAVLVVCAIVVSRSFAEKISTDLFFSLTLAGYLVVFVSTRPLRELARVIAVGLAFGGLQWFVLKTPPQVIPLLALLGLGALLFLIAKRILGENSQQLRDAITPPLLLILLGSVASAPLALTSRLHPKTLDLFLYRFDQSFGTQLSFKAGQAVLSSWISTRIAIGAYYLLPIMIMLIYARQLKQDRHLALSTFLAFMFIAPIGVVFYNMVPACGPEYLFTSRFPLHPLAAQEIKQLPIQPISLAGARNAFPSLHLAWALLIWWYSENLSLWMKGFCFAFLTVTAIVTLGLGEHYFVDLVAAFPLALALYAGCGLQLRTSSSRLRVAAMVVGLAMTGCWAALVRWGTTLVDLTPFIPWLLTAFTVAATVWLRRRIARADFVPGTVES